MTHKQAVIIQDQLRAEALGAMVSFIEQQGGMDIDGLVEQIDEYGETITNDLVNDALRPFCG